MFRKWSRHWLFLAWYAASAAVALPAMAPAPPPPAGPGHGGPVTDPQDVPASSVRFNEVFRVATHNSYWVKRDNVVEAFASGVQERILDELLFDHARGLEIDIHKADARPREWDVYHTNMQSNSFCSPFRECLKQLRQFQRALPRHEPLIIVLELKEILEYNFDSDHTPADLDRILEEELGPYLYRPRDLLARCGSGMTLRQCVATVGWPTVEELRGKILVAPMGNWRWCTIGHGGVGWATYATWGGGVAERSGFPMESNWIDLTHEGCGPDYVPPRDLQAAKDASIFMQAEDLSPAKLAEAARLLADGVLIRGSDSFSIADQGARLRAGFQLLQTDHPWLQFDEEGPARPFRALKGAFEDPRALLEPGNRIELRKLKSGDWAAFAPARTLGAAAPGGGFRDTGSGAVSGGASGAFREDWETLPSTTRTATSRTYPNPRAPRGKGCLEAAGEGGVFRVCRQTVDGKWYVSKPVGEDIAVTAEWIEQGRSDGRTLYSAAHTSEGAGDELRLRVEHGADGSACVQAFSAASVSREGDPEWKEVASHCFAGSLGQVGLAASSGDVLFVGTLRTVEFPGQAPSVEDITGASLEAPDPVVGGYLLIDESAP